MLGASLAEFGFEDEAVRGGIARAGAQAFRDLHHLASGAPGLDRLGDETARHRNEHCRLAIDLLDRIRPDCNRDLNGCPAW